MDNTQLTAIATEIGKQYGYDDIEARFSGFKDFKIKWRRSYKWISFEVSDYITDMPEHMVRNIFEIMFAKIRGSNKDYLPEVKDYISSLEFAGEHHGEYFKRSRNLRADDGRVVGAWERLTDKYNLYKNDPIPYFAIMKGDSMKAGVVSKCFRTIALNENLLNLEDDDLIIPALAVFMEWLRIPIGETSVSPVKAVEDRYGLNFLEPLKHMGYRF